MLKPVEFLVRLGWSKSLLRPSVPFVVILLVLVSGCCQPEIDCENEPQVEPEPIIDQKLPGDASPLFYYNNLHLGPMGQVFVPDLYALDFVTLYVADASCSLSDEIGGDLFVRIRKSSITGPIIGVSNTLHFDNCFRGLKIFQFPSYVALSPGKRYVIEAVYSSGDSSVILVSLDASEYPKGVLYLSGVEKPGENMFFQEGILSSLPKSRCDCAERFKHVLGPSGRPFRSVADCIQYVSSDDV